MTITIQTDVSLRSANTLQVDCTADQRVAIHSLDEFLELTQMSAFLQTPRKLVLGGGSNILLSENSYQGLVISNQITGREIIHEDHQSVTIRCGAGENRDEFVWWSIDQGYTGIENLVSIPGTVGAAPMQNIGAYGVEISSHIYTVTGHDRLQHKTKHFTPDSCCFGYRTSLFKEVLVGRFFISHVILQLDKYDPETYQPNLSYGIVGQRLSDKEISTPTPHQLAETISEIRAEKLPDRHETGTAGSFFQNPIVPASRYEQLKTEHPLITGIPVDDGYVKLSAGQLIELAGYKGKTSGPGHVGTYHKHALVIVHDGKGDGQEILSFVQEIQTAVRTFCGITLQPEVRII